MGYTAERWLLSHASPRDPLVSRLETTAPGLLPLQNWQRKLAKYRLNWINTPTNLCQKCIVQHSEKPHPSAPIVETYYIAGKTIFELKTKKHHFSVLSPD
jgi:hypothetical protein